MLTNWNSLEDTARVWGFAFENVLTDQLCEDVLNDLVPFIDSWNSHQMAVKASAQWQFNRFLFIAGGNEHQKVSGCGIDSMQLNVKATLSKYNLSPLEAGIVVWKDTEKNWHFCRWLQTSSAYREEMKLSAVAIFSPMPHSLAELRNTWPWTPSHSPLFLLP